MSKWGVKPEEALAILRKRFWGDIGKQKALLKDAISFPIELPLKPPTGTDAYQNIALFQGYLKEWQNSPLNDHVQWITLSTRKLGEQRVPKTLIIRNAKQLIAMLGGDVSERVEQRLSLIRQLMEAINPPPAHAKAIYLKFIDYLPAIDRANNTWITGIAAVINQLSQGMGNGQYLRALPLRGVDTKFVEQNFSLIESLQNILTDNTVNAQGGLLTWLNCKSRPDGWLMVRPLCDNAKRAMGGFNILQLSTDEISTFNFPATNLLIVENRESGLTLPPLKDTIAICGTGKNLRWLETIPLENKRVAYWGDIDEEGLLCLSYARQFCPHSIDALMMSRQELHQYSAMMVSVQSSVKQTPEHLREDEIDLFNAIKAGEYDGMNRLEQEYIANDYAYERLENWAKSGH